MAENKKQSWKPLAVLAGVGGVAWVLSESGGGQAGRRDEDARDRRRTTPDLRQQQLIENAQHEDRLREVAVMSLEHGNDEERAQLLGAMWRPPGRVGLAAGRGRRASSDAAWWDRNYRTAFFGIQNYRRGLLPEHAVQTRLAALEARADTPARLAEVVELRMDLEEAAAEAPAAWDEVRRHYRRGW